MLTDVFDRHDAIIPSINISTLILDGSDGVGAVNQVTSANFISYT